MWRGGRCECVSRWKGWSSAPCACVPGGSNTAGDGTRVPPLSGGERWTGRRSGAKSPTARRRAARCELGCPGRDLLRRRGSEYPARPSAPRSGLARARGRGRSSPGPGRSHPRTSRRGLLGLIEPELRQGVRLRSAEVVGVLARLAKRVELGAYDIAPREHSDVRGLECVGRRGVVRLVGRVDDDVASDVGRQVEDHRRPQRSSPCRFRLRGRTFAKPASIHHRRGRQPMLAGDGVADGGFLASHSMHRARRLATCARTSTDDRGSSSVAREATCRSGRFQWPARWRCRVCLTPQPCALAWH